MVELVGDYQDQWDKEKLVLILNEYVMMKELAEY